ncbi:MAG: helix-turn-helix domain-containing protein [Ruminococcaceae bacterium]|nr:helix-turn-helix domain-containing protein [Oscillospiraceae bacterium]
MLSDNIKNFRKEKGLSQEELAIRLNVVRQTVSKWEQNLSVPDSDMLVKLAEVFEVSVGTLLGEDNSKQEDNTVQEFQQDKCTACRKKSKKRKIMTAVAVIMFIAAFLMLLNIILAYFIYPFWRESHSIGIIGGADGPTAILVADVSADILARVIQIAAACVLVVVAIVIIKKSKK